MQIFLIRHGRTTAPDAYNGSTDIELSTEGMGQVSQSAALLRSIDFDACYCSPLQRCRKTFEILDLNSTAIVQDELREIDFGRWEGLTLAQIAEQDREGLDRWQQDRERFTFPDGECIASFGQRIGTWFDGLLGADHERVLVVAHAGVIRRALCHMLALGPDHVFRFVIREAAVTLVTRRRNFCVLEYLNRGVAIDG